MLSLEENYQVFYKGNSVGMVQVSREGLYSRLICKCRVSDSEIHRLYADEEKIGVLMPERGGLELDTKLPARRLKPGVLFSLDKNSVDFIPIIDGVCFQYLHRLRTAKLSFRDGVPGLYL